MDAHSDLAYVIDAQGRERDALIDDPRPDTGFCVVVFLSPGEPNPASTAFVSLRQMGAPSVALDTGRLEPFSADWCCCVLPGVACRRVAPDAAAQLDADRFGLLGRAAHGGPA